MEEHLKELQQIRSIMERSGRFLSLSGASGILAGCYAIAGTLVFSYLQDYPLFDTGGLYIQALASPPAFRQAVIIAALVLLASLGTGMAMSWRKSRRDGTSWWSAPARQMLVNLLLPLFAGGIVCFLMGWQMHFSLIPGLTLVFYGLALFAASRYTFNDIRYLGLAEVILGLAAIARPDFGLLSWMTGFGLFHILYGIVMYFRYERPVVKS